MPKKPQVVQSSSYDMEANDLATIDQANETFLLTAKNNQSIGSGGETLGFAKRNMGDLLKDYSAIDSSTSEGEIAAVSQEMKLAKVLTPASDMMIDRDGALNPKVPGDRGLLTRSVASSQVDQLFGANVTSEERFGVDDEGKVIGISVQADGGAVQSEYAIGGPETPKVDCRLDVDYSDPEIQKGLSDLEAMDYITGQYDRHAGNIYIDPVTKKVTGIDNDLAFPEVSRDELIVRRRTECKAVKNPPLMMHKDTADKIMSVTPEQLEETLRNMPRPKGVSPLSEAAIQGAKTRLTELQSRISESREAQQKGLQPEMQIVDAFDQETYQAAIQKQDEHINSYAESKGFSKVGEWKHNTKQGEITDAGVTSYVGTVRVNEHIRSLSLVKKQANQNALEVGLRSPETVGLAKRDTKLVLQQVADLEKESATLKRQAGKYDARIESPSVRDRFRSLLPGKNKESIARTNAEKRDYLLNEATKLDQQRMGIIKREAEHGKVAVQRNQRANIQQNNQVQNQVPQVEDVNLRNTQKVEIQGEKLPTVGLRPNVLRPPTPELPKVPEVDNSGLNQENNGSLKRSNSDVAGLKKVGSGSLSNSSQKLESEIELKDSQNNIGSSANIKPTNDRPKVDAPKVGKGIGN